MENIRNEQMYKNICKKIGIDLIDNYIYRKQKEDEYHAINGWKEDDRPFEVIYREIYGEGYVDIYKDLNIEELKYIQKVYSLLRKKNKIMEESDR